MLGRNDLGKNTQIGFQLFYKFFGVLFEFSVSHLKLARLPSVNDVANITVNMVD